MLAICKKKFEEFKNMPQIEEFYSLVKEYCFEVFIEVDDYGRKLCSYE